MKNNMTSDIKIRMILILLLGIGISCLLFICIIKFKNKETAPDVEEFATSEEQTHATLEELLADKGNAITTNIVNNDSANLCLKVKETSFEYGTEFSYMNWNNCLPKDFYEDIDGFWHSDEYGISIKYIVEHDLNTYSKVRNYLKDQSNIDIPDDYDFGKEGIWFYTDKETPYPYDNYIIEVVSEADNIVAITKYNNNDLYQEGDYCESIIPPVTRICRCKYSQKDIEDEIAIYTENNNYYEKTIKSSFKAYFDNENLDRDEEIKVPSSYYEDIELCSASFYFACEKLFTNGRYDTEHEDEEDYWKKVNIIARFYYGANRDKAKQFGDYTNYYMLFNSSHVNE